MSKYKNKGNPERNQFRIFFFFFSYILDLGLEVGMTKKRRSSRWWMVQLFEQNKQKRKESKEREKRKKKYQ